MRKKEIVEELVTKYLSVRVLKEFSKTAIKEINKFDGSTKLKIKDLGLEGAELEKFVLEEAESTLTNNKKFREDFSERLIAILNIIEHLPEKQEGKNKIKAKKTTEFTDFKNIAEKQCDKIVFYPKGKKPITFTTPMLIKTIIDSMALPSPHFEKIKKHAPHLDSEVDLMEMANNMDILYSQCVVWLRDEVEQIFGSHPASFINLVTYELLELVGVEPSTKTDKAKISYIQKKHANLGNQK